MRFKVRFPITEDMSPIDYIVSDKPMESKEEEALWHYNHSRAHDGLAPLALDEMPYGVTFTPIETEASHD